MKPNIAFCGFMETGKTTGADYLVKNYGYKKISFADELKIKTFDLLWESRLSEGTIYDYQTNAFQILVDIGLDPFDFPAPCNGYISEDIEECRLEKLYWVNANKQWLRPLLQKLGTEYYRAKDPDYWIKKLSIQYSKYYMNNSVAVDDVRFENEAKYLKEAGFKLVYITRKGKSSSAHKSEDLNWIQHIKPIMVYNPEDNLELFYNSIEKDIIYEN